MTVFSSSRKSLDLRNSSISVRGLGGAVCARMGMSLGNSNSSSLMYWAPLPFTLLLLGRLAAACYLPFAVDFLLAAVGVHVVELVLLVAGGGGAAQVQVVRVPDGGADSHLVREGLHGRGGVGSGLGGAGPRCVSLELGLQQCVVNCV